MILPFIVSALSLLYLYFIVRAIFLWTKTPAKKSILKATSFPVSVLVIARNESKYIQQCLQSIQVNAYPAELYEIILVDDHSEDNTVALAEALHISNLKVVDLSMYDLSKFSGKHKKAAQYYGVLEATNEIILQTDADCIVPPQWIREMSDSFQNVDLVTAPISIKSYNDILSKWQTYDIIGTMVVTYIGILFKSWYSANAANMAYRKEVFLEFARASESNNLASGDDIFLINWAQEKKYQVEFLKLKETVVETFPERSVLALYRQRIRWATKTKSYSSSGIKWIMIAFFLFHTAIVLLIFTAIFYDPSYFFYGIIALAVKWIADCILLVQAAPFFGHHYQLLLSPLFSVLHTVYIVFIGIAGLCVRSYKWKGREVS